MDRVVPCHDRDEGGFTLIEVMVAAVILVVGLLSLAYAFGMGFGVIATAQMDSIARQKARQAIEDVYTARDTGSISFSQICNIGSGASCIFINGYEPLYTAGPDGLVNTADDGTGTLPTGCSVTPCIETVDTPGPDGILGTADDVFVPLVGFQRQIQITPLTAVLNQITVTINYTTPTGISRSVTLVGLIGPYV
jgi:prepilin-type N-terminal cleavage/methylation domain-containing protein